MDNSSSTLLFESLRGASLSKSDVYLELKKMSKNIGESYYIFLKEDLKIYLKVEKELMHNSFSKQQIINKLSKLESEGKPVAKFAPITTKKGELPAKYLNLEAIFYPKEFNNLYTLTDILNEEIKANNVMNSQSEPANTMDFSDSKGTEKIIMLYLLGALDELKKIYPFNFSINALASAISGVTGEKAGTIQSYLNPIYSSGSNQKNNPLMNLEKVNIIRDKLINLGFKPIK